MHSYITRKLSGPSLALIVGLQSGCAAFKGSREVTRNPENPSLETVTTKSCRPLYYPFMITAGVCKDSGMEAETDTFSKIFRRVGWTVVCVPIGVALDALVMPLTLPGAVFSSDCKGSIVTRDVPGYREQVAKPAHVSIENLGFRDSTGSGLIQGGENGAISFTLRNDPNAGPARALVAVLDAQPSTGLRFNKSTPLASLEPGASATVELPLAASDAIGDGSVALTISFREAGQNPPDPAQIKVQSRTLRPPTIAIARVGLDDGSYSDKRRIAFGNADGVWQPGESVEIYVTVSNTGEGRADKVVVAISGDDERNLRVLDYGRFRRRYEIGDLRPRESRQLAFALSLSRLYPGKPELPLVLTVSERRRRFNTTLPLGILIGRRMATPQVLDVTPAEESSETTPAITFSLDSPPTDCTPSFYVSVPRDSTWYYGAGAGSSVAEARQNALQALARQAGGTAATTGFEQDDAKVCKGSVYILVRVEKDKVPRLSLSQGERR